MHSTLATLTRSEADPSPPESTTSDASRGDAFYNSFFLDGGWKYSTWREYLWHRQHVVKRFKLRRGMQLLEVACGSGFHTNLFRRMGFDTVGIDRSSVGIEWAKRHYPKCQFHCRDLFDDLPVQRGSFDVVLARGCSHYHYDLASEKSLRTSQHLLEYLKPGGVFVMVIVTDLSGRRDPDKVWQNKLEDYERHFASFHRPYSVNWHKNMAVCGLWNSTLGATSVCA